MKNKSDILILSLSVAIALIALAVLVFFFKTIENKNKHTSVVLATLADKVKQKENMKSLVEKISKVSEMSDTINSYFVNGKEVDSFINYLENLGASAGVELEVQNFDVSTTSKEILNVTISTKGNFSNTMKTLMLIENAPYKINITKTFLDQSTESSNPDPKNPEKQINTSFWRSEISFNVLTS